MPIITDDPHADFDRYDAELEKRLARLPRCSRCKEPIEDEELFDFDDVFICEECVFDYVSDKFKKNTSEYVTPRYVWVNADGC